MLKLLLGGSWVVISGVISPLIWVTSIVTLLIIITLLITNHEPPSIRFRSCRVAELWEKVPMGSSKPGNTELTG